MRYFTLLLCLTGLASCYSEPEFPVEPEIEFKGVRFIDVPEGSVNSSDTLKITVSFKDGDGDLGMLDPLPDPLITKFKNQDDQFVYVLKDAHDSLPDPNCTNYASGYFKQIPPPAKFPEQKDSVFITSLKAEEITSTIYVQPNPLYYNFLVDLYTVRDEIESRFDFVELGDLGCGIAPHGQFYLPASTDSGPISGLITYNFTSSQLKAYFLGEELRLRVRITDRAGNISNVAESPLFTLTEIQQ